jgi:hypothetical protein
MARYGRDQLLGIAVPIDEVEQPTIESAIDPEDDQGHIERHRKDEKGNRVEERLVAQCGRHHAPVHAIEEE